MARREAGSERVVVSRRARPAKAPLSREGIVETALGLLARDGLGGLRLRNVAAALDTGAASLYVYVANQAELHALVLDRALGDVRLPPAGTPGAAGDWRRSLKGLLLSYFETLCARPGLAQLAMGTIPTGPNALRITDRILGLLLDGGVDGPTAAWAVDLLTLYVTAIAVEHTAPQASDSVGQAERVMRAVSPEEYPRIFELRDSLFSGERMRFGWALDVLLAGLLSRDASAPGRGAEPS
ncbi:MAG TPA: TetR/AcrR family transcriptional regulator C-terminal domain-containing protein [Solirubrobacterales bacterium]